MKFTIGTVSNSIDFAEDLHLIKSSLLYADEIELIGMVEYALLNYLPRMLQDAKDFYSLIDTIRPLLKAIDNTETRAIEKKIEDLLIQLEPYRGVFTKKKHRTKKELLAQIKMGQEMKKLEPVLNNALNPILNSEGAFQLLSLEKKGLITIHDYEYRDFDQSTLAGGYFGALLRTMQDNTSFPLFDDISNKAISSFVDTNVIQLNSLDQETLKHAGIATSILMTLPTLETASFDEILDFKKDMQGPLINFRRAIYEFSGKIQSLPWDKDFKYECLKLYEMEVAPRVEELNVLSSENSVLKNFGKHVLADENVRKEAGFLVAGLATTITTNTNFVGAAELMFLVLNYLSKIGVAKTTITSSLRMADFYVKAREEAKKKTNEMKENIMYYYYMAKKL